jgi:hypothetical protein
MAVKRVREGWLSTRDGGVYDSEMAAQHYEKEATMRQSKPSIADEIIDKIPTKDLPEFFNGLARRTAETQGKIDVHGELLKFLRKNPEFENNSQNAAILHGHIKGRGLDPKVITAEQLQESYDALRETETGLEKEQDEDPYSIPLNELVRKSGGIRSGL